MFLRLAIGNGLRDQVKHIELEAEEAFLVDNSILKSKTSGVGYRRSMDLGDKDGNDIADWGSVVRGVREGDDWLKVGDRYLPMEIGGKLVLKILEDVRGVGRERRQRQSGKRARGEG